MLQYLGLIKVKDVREMESEQEEISNECTAPYRGKTYASVYSARNGRYDIAR